MYYVYILQDEAGKKYVGFSENLKTRLQKHLSSGVQTTKPYRKIRLEFYAAFRDKLRALDFEKYLKRGSGHAFAKKHLT